MLLAQDLEALKSLARGQHKPGALTTACFCVCGNSMGGPAGPAACKALRAIGDVLASVQDFLLRHPRLAKEIPEHIRRDLDILTLTR